MKMVIISRISLNSKCLSFRTDTHRALVELKEAWELMKECYREDGVPVPKAPSRTGYEGPVNIPIDAQLYHALANEAAEARVSLYALVAQKLGK